MTIINKERELNKLRLILFGCSVALLIFIYFFVIGLAQTYPDLDLNDPLESSIINGLLTGFAIIFGFASNEIREIKTGMVEKFLITFPLVLFFIISVVKYAGDALQHGYPNYWTLLAVTSGITFTVFYSLLLTLAKDAYNRING